jgi:hypothetical protein
MSVGHRINSLAPVVGAVIELHHLARVTGV